MIAHPAVLKLFEERPFSFQRSPTPCKAYRKDKQLRELTDPAFEGEVEIFSSVHTDPLRISFENPHRVTHVCLLRRHVSKTPAGPFMLTCMFEGHNDIVQGPYLIPEGAGWTCIPLEHQLGVKGLTLCPSGGELGLWLGRVVCLTEPESASVTNVMHMLLEAVANRLFGLPGDASSDIAEHADAFLEALPTDRAFGSDGSIRAHSAILAARCRNPAAPFPERIPGFADGIVARALWFMYTGNVERLAGWFAAAGQALGCSDSPEIFAVKQLNVREHPHAMALAFVGGALPFLLFALRYGVPALQQACEEHFVHTVLNTAAINDHLDALLALARDLRLEYAAHMLIVAAFAEAMPVDEIKRGAGAGLRHIFSRVLDAADVEEKELEKSLAEEFNASMQLRYARAADAPTPIFSRATGRKGGFPAVSLAPPGAMFVPRAELAAVTALEGAAPEFPAALVSSRRADDQGDESDVVLTLRATHRRDGDTFSVFARDVVPEACDIH
eukprot:gnl/Chilomastix_cuspidata/1302.p1 GENE.gnl/Chilomastix_cuspidata/1302~~gnl/Chilomastix_cuspidata/1302.p1  ORF type:complete len:511 (-),score=174.84 gnl/Chilomastix_cuspidata/1302:1197-2699(-)